MKSAWKYGIIIFVAYSLTLCMIYNCIPDLIADRKATIVTQNDVASDVATHVTKDVFKLNWIESENAFFKKVKRMPNSSDSKQITKTNNGNTGKQCFDEQTGKFPGFTKLNSQVFVYSAYYDNRTGQPYIRIISALLMNASKSTKLWCHFEVPTNTKYPAFAASKVEYYEMCENHKRSYGGWFLSCAVPASIGTVPSFVKIGNGSEPYHSLRNSTPVCVHSTNNVRKRKFGVCVPPVFGQVQPKVIIEFIELSKLLGADGFVFYVDINTSGENKKVLDHYATTYHVTVLPWQLPVSRKDIWYHGQSLAINDCMYRHMDTFEYITFIDMDEFLIPHGVDRTWSDMILRMSDTDQSEFNRASGFAFRNTFFDADFSRLVFANELNSVIRTNRTQHFSHFRNKVMVRPSRVFELGIHHVSRSWPDHRNYTVMSVSPELAYVHHYRSCVLEFGIHCRRIVEDFAVPIKYGKLLMDRYQQTVAHILP